jgi:hypothetical protein
MGNNSSLRHTSTAALVAVLAAALSAPVALAAPAGCRPKVSPPTDLTDGDGPEFEKAPVLRITDAATEKRPVSVEFSHGPGVVVSDAASQNSRFFKLAVVASGSATRYLNVRSEWPTPSPSNLDLYLYRGDYVAGSGAFNNPVLDAAHNQIDPQEGGMGYEWIRDYPVFSCQGYALESFANWTAGETVTLKVWLSRKPAVEVD